MSKKITNAEIFAAWLIFANLAGKNGRLIPTDDEVLEIIAKKPAHWTEALAVGQAFVQKVVEEEPRSLATATGGFLREVDRIQEKFGSFLSAGPTKAKRT